MQRFIPLLCLLLLGVTGSFLSCSSQSPNQASSAEVRVYSQVREFFDPDWAMDKLWDDGLAEVAVYEAERVIYGKKRQFEYTLITVKEDFNREHNVKTDDYSRAALFPVMKVNQFARIPTDNYPYHYMTSVFVHRAQPWALHKLTTSSQEWCGTTFKAVTDEGATFSQYYNSYFDGQGEGNRLLPKEVLLEDQLPYTLRALRFQDGLTFRANVLESLQDNTAAEPAIYKAELTGIKAEVDGEAAWQVNVQLDDKKVNRYWFSAQYPNQLLRQETWDGRSLRLKEASRYAYWQRGENQ